MGKRIFLTGGSGFLGRRILETLQQRGHEVIAPGRPEFDLMDEQSVIRSVTRAKPEIVIHSAAYYGGLGINIHEPANLFHHNVIMTAHLLEACGKAGISKFVSIGSACSYPGEVNGEMREIDYWSGPLHPSVEAYGFSKKAQQVGARAYGKQYGFKSQCPQFTNLYGEHDVFTEYRSHVVSALIKRFADAVENGDAEVTNWGTGRAIREFMYVGDAAEAVARLIDVESTKNTKNTNSCCSPENSIINIGTGIGVSIKELAELIARFTGFQGEIRWDTSKPDGVAKKVLDVSQMKKILGWIPPTSLEEGLKKTIDWYLANREEANTRS